MVVVILGFGVLGFFWLLFWMKLINLCKALLLSCKIVNCLMTW